MRGLKYKINIKIPINKRGQLTIGRWHFKLGVISIYWERNGFLAHFGIFKLLKYPPEGEKFSKAQYKGFWLRKEFKFEGWEISL